MRKTLPVVLLALALLAPLALASDHRPTPPTPESGDRRGGGDDRGTDRADDGSGRGRSDEARGRLRPVAPAAIGEFSLSASRQTVDGDYVDFSYNATGVTGFTVDGLRLFDLNVAGESGEDGEDVVARGAHLRLDTPYYKLRVHDNPAAVVKLETHGVATLLFPAGTEFTRLDDERVSFTIANVTGTLRGAGVRVSGPNVIVDDEMLVLVHRPVGGFDTHRADIGTAIAKRHVGAEAMFNKKDDGVQQDVLSYGNVTIHTVKAEQGNLTVLIDGHGFDGRVVVLNVDGRVIGADSSEKLHVLFDNASIAQADSVTDVLDPDDDGLQPEYYVIFDPETQAFQLLVSVPHYSVHSLSIMTLVQVPPPSVVAGVLAGLLVLAASGAVLFRRPKA